MERGKCFHVPDLVKARLPHGQLNCQRGEAEAGSVYVKSLW